jgi:hypothetical protein
LKTWVLGVELNGEWEHCAFSTKKEALASFAALTTDYPVKIVRAVLFQQPLRQEPQSAQESKYIN